MGPEGLRISEMFGVVMTTLGCYGIFLVSLMVAF